MIDENRRNPIVFWIFFSLFLLICFFVFAEPLPREFTASPVWYKKITGGASMPPSGTESPFVIDGISGFFSAEGFFHTVAAQSSSILMGETSWLALPPREPAIKTIMSMKAQALGSIPANEIPFFAGKRLFSTSIDTMRLASYTEKGEALWNYAFPCQLSAFDANEALAAAGMLDGSVELVGNDGKQLSIFSPGGSRLQVILGLSSSANGNYIAMVSGIDRQRLVILGRGDKDYRVVAHRYLESDFRTPVSVFILPDDRYVLYEQPDGIGVFSIDGKENIVLPIQAQTFSVHRGFKSDLYYIVAKNDDSAELIVFSPPDRILGRVLLPPGTDFYRFTAKSLFLGYESGLSRIDFKEE